MLCVVGAPVEPRLTLAAAYGTAVGSSLGPAGLPQYEQNLGQAMLSLFSLQGKTALQGCHARSFYLVVQGGLVCSFTRYSAPCPKAGLHAWEEPTLPHDTGL